MGTLGIMGNTKLHLAHVWLAMMEPLQHASCAARQPYFTKASHPLRHRAYPSGIALDVSVHRRTCHVISDLGMTAPHLRHLSMGPKFGAGKGGGGAVHLLDNLDTFPLAPISAALSASSLSCSPVWPYTCMNVRTLFCCTRRTKSRTLAASSSFALGSQMPCAMFAA